MSSSKHSPHRGTPVLISLIAIFLGIMTSLPAAAKKDPKWHGTAPFCGASCSDCKGARPVCMDKAKKKSDANWKKGDFGNNCSSGSKVLCGPKGSKVDPRWHGSAPFCGASCSDCKGDTPVCMDKTGKKDRAHAKKGDFGNDCSSGSKVLCGSVGATVYPRWRGTAPACGASCSDCKGDTPVCMDQAKNKDKAQAQSGNFGSSCTSGSKVLCGPPGSTVYPRWRGTAPACNASCSDCKGDTPVCMDQARNKDHAHANKGLFGNSCSTGSKVLCGPPGSKIYPRWRGTAPACGASCDDCKGDTPVCIDRRSQGKDALQEAKYFGNKCTSGAKVLCAPRNTDLKEYGFWVGTAPICNGKKSDCPGYSTPTSKASKATQADYRGFGNNCTSGDKWFCKGADSGKLRVGFAHQKEDPANGCGDGCTAGGVKLSQFGDFLGIPGTEGTDFRKICVEHDRCYYTKGMPKNWCDVDFRSRLLATCPLCVGQDVAEYLAVVWGGGGPYTKNQEAASRHLSKGGKGNLFDRNRIIGGWAGGGGYAKTPGACKDCKVNSDKCPANTCDGDPAASYAVCVEKSCLCTNKRSTKP